MTDVREIRAWVERGKREGATHVIIACDSFDHDDYPVLVMPGENPREKAAGLGEMQRVMECYAMHLDLEEQLVEHRAFHYDMPPAPAPKGGLRLVK